MLQIIVISLVIAAVICACMSTGLVSAISALCGFSVLVAYAIYKPNTH